jgi:hypothetical protein
LTLPLSTQLGFLETHGFKDVNCWYKYYRYAVYSGFKPSLELQGGGFKKKSRAEAKPNEENPMAVKIAIIGNDFKSSHPVFTRVSPALDEAAAPLNIPPLVGPSYVLVFYQETCPTWSFFSLRLHFLGSKTLL